MLLSLHTPEVVVGHSTLGISPQPAKPSLTDAKPLNNAHLVSSERGFSWLDNKRVIGLSLVIRGFHADCYSRTLTMQAQLPVVQKQLWIYVSSIL